MKSICKFIFQNSITSFLAEKDISSDDKIKFWFAADINEDHYILI